MRYMGVVNIKKSFIKFIIMKTNKFFIIALTVFLALAIMSCDKSESNAENSQETLLSLLKVSNEGVSAFTVENICPVLAATNPLTADEIEFLYAMREDEKLSKDLYTAFAVRFPPVVPFSKISAAEATHVAAIEKVLAYYEIEFLALGEAGVFVDPQRQERYNTLLLQGTVLLNAYLAMAALEEENVAVYTSVATDAANTNIKMLLENMVRSSSNHLKAAVRQITALGGSYVPTTLEQAAFDQIISSQYTQGKQYRCQYGHDGQSCNTNSRKHGNGQGNKGAVCSAGDCTCTCNGTAPGVCDGQGGVGKNYRHGKK